MLNLSSFSCRRWWECQPEKTWQNINSNLKVVASQFMNYLYIMSK